MEEIVKVFSQYVSNFVEASAAVIIAVGVVRALGVYLHRYLKRGDNIQSSEIRVSLGRTLALALEFLLAADIVRTAVAPTWDDIGKLAAIAVLRTGLNFFLERELKSGETTPPVETKSVV